MTNTASLSSPLYTQATEQICLAVEADAANDKSKALSHYNDSLKLVSTLLDSPISHQQRTALQSKFCEYANRTSQLISALCNNPAHTAELDNAHGFLTQARTHYQQQNQDPSAIVDMFVKGISCYQRVLSNRGSKDCSSWRREIQKFAATCLNEAEAVKKIHRNNKTAKTSSPPPRFPHRDRSSQSRNTHRNSTDIIERLDPKEMEVVRLTSHVNGLTFLPWMARDNDEDFSFEGYFVDKDGLPSLSSKQERRLWRWQRASHLHKNPTIFGHTGGCSHIVQETVTDCSFVAALCVSVEYEYRFGRQLITRHVFPRCSAGRPVFNPAGKYMVKMFVNGLWRRVVIDDQLPVAENGRLLCTYSVAGDIGQSLMEKAFLKVMGGYDFPGSNSSTDLHILTGWIPEHVFIQGQSFDPDRVWSRIQDGVSKGDLLMTIATGEMSAEVANSLGLVPSHAYAVLGVCEAAGHRLLNVKNPWSSHRWNGAFSPADHIRWTQELRQLLAYDPTAAEAVDCGTFWIDYESVCHRFDAIHLNWNPDVFGYRSTVHFAWELDQGPRQTVHDFSSNPQYTLSIGDGSGVGSEQKQQVWILLSKHILKTEENKDYIALHVYNTANGRRVYESQAAVHIGEYVNAPHVLVQLAATPDQRYVLVVAQRNKTKSLYFTLRAYCDLPVGLNNTPVYSFHEVTNNQWGSATSGGNTALPRYMDNPQYRLTIKGDTTTAKQTLGALTTNGIVTLEAAQKHPVNLRIFKGGYLVTRVLEINSVASSDKYRSQYCSCPLEDLEEGNYTIVPSTFEPFMFSRFKLAVNLDLPFTLSPIPREGAGMRKRELHGHWLPPSSTVIAPADPGNRQNSLPHHNGPVVRFLVHTSSPATTVLARLQTPQADPLPLINVSVFAFDNAVLGPVCASSGSYTNSPQGVAIRPTELGSTEYLVAASAWDYDTNARFVLYFYSEEAIEICPFSDHMSNV